MAGSSSNVAVFILAGGKSTRMGADKAFVEFEGRTLVARALDVTRSVVADVRIVGSAEKFAALAPVVEDVFRDCGPLGGIHAALRASAAELNLVLAVDMPFVSAELLRYLVTRAKNSPEAVATVPQAAGGWQPLCAVYRRAFADAAEQALRAGRYKIDALFDATRICVISEEDLQTAGFIPRMLLNINTPQELAEARK